MKAELDYATYCETCDVEGNVIKTPDGWLDGDTNCPTCGYLMAVAEGCSPVHHRVMVRLNGPEAPVGRYEHIDLDGASVLALEVSDFDFDHLEDMERGAHEDYLYDLSRGN